MGIISDFILKHATETQAKLPEDPRHPFGRNAIAHYYSMLKWAWSVEKTSDIPDCDFERVMKYLHEIYTHCEDANYIHEKIVEPVTLEKFF